MTRSWSDRARIVLGSCSDRPLEWTFHSLLSRCMVVFLGCLHPRVALRTVVDILFWFALGGMAYSYCVLHGTAGPGDKVLMVYEPSGSKGFWCVKASKSWLL